MKIVLLSSSQRLTPQIIEDARAKIQTEAPVDVISYSPALQALDDVAASHVVTGVRGRPTTLPAKVMRKLERTKPGRGVRRFIVGGLSRRMWSSIRGNPNALRLLDHSDIVVALDTASIRTAWHIARRRDDVAVVYGAAGAAHAVRSVTRTLSEPTSAQSPTSGR